MYSYEVKIKKGECPSYILDIKCDGKVIFHREQACCVGKIAKTREDLHTWGERVFSQIVAN